MAFISSRGVPVTASQRPGDGRVEAAARVLGEKFGARGDFERDQRQQDAHEVLAAADLWDQENGWLRVPVDLLQSLADPDDCWLDHHGGCQAHGYISLTPDQECPQHELKRRLREAAEQ